MTKPEDPTGFAINPGERVDDAVRRIVREQVDQAVKRIDRSRPDDPRTVHELRKSCKRIRSVLRLVRGELEASGIFARENAALRDLARNFSGLRDADVALASYDMLMDAGGARLDRRGFAPVRAALTRQRRAVLDTLEIDIAQLLQQARAELLALRERVMDWPIRRRGFKAIGPGLLKTYTRAYRRRREALATLDIEIMHEWRKRTKYHRHHLRLIRFIWPPLIEARHVEADRLGELLGDERDLRLLRDKIATEDAAFGRIRTRRKFIREVDRRRDALRREAFALGQRLFAERPEDYLRSVRAWWDSYEAEGPAASAYAAPAKDKPAAKPKSAAKTKVAANANTRVARKAARGGANGVVPRNGVGHSAAAGTIALSDLMAENADLVRAEPDAADAATGDAATGRTPAKRRAGGV